MSRQAIPYLGTKLLQKSHLVPLLPYAVAREHLVFIFDISPDQISLAVAEPRPAVIRELKMILKRPIKIYRASPELLKKIIDQGYRDIHHYKALQELRERNPEESAYRVLYPWQQKFILFCSATLGIALLAAPYGTWLVFFTFINVFYFLTNPIKLYISFKGFSGFQRTVAVSAAELKKLRADQLPVYTILIPLYKEKNILPAVKENISRLDYPHHKLDIKIILEELDVETITAAQHMTWPDCFQIVIVPEADIKTKPRACNYALQRARGEYCVIYDAEDDPDPDQLKKALVAFRKLKDKFVCLQGKLNFYNPDENFLTGWFTLEYNYWFDFYLEGLDSVGAPLPLGGTSNHFRTKELKRLGGWDPYNVTEDADLGIRIAARAQHTAMINSYTYEEANNQVGNWIRQRSRWQKGYFQTYLVHMRHPLRLLKTLGLRQFLFFQLSFGGTIFLPLINPLLWLVTLLSWVSPHPWIPQSLALFCLFNLIVGNITYMICHLISTILHRNYRLIPLALLIPLYWILISIGAWKGALQLITKPFYWEKTTHGLSKQHKKKR